MVIAALLLLLANTCFLFNSSLTSNVQLTEDKRMSGQRVSLLWFPVVAYPTLRGITLLNSVASSFLVMLLAIIFTRRRHCSISMFSVVYQTKITATSPKRVVPSMTIPSFDLSLDPLLFFHLKGIRFAMWL